LQSLIFLVHFISEPRTALNLAFLAAEHRLTYLCFDFAALSIVTFAILSAVSLLTLSAISVDTLLALILGLRYRLQSGSKQLLSFIGYPV